MKESDISIKYVPGINNGLLKNQSIITVTKQTKTLNSWAVIGPSDSCLSFITCFISLSFSASGTSSSISSVLACKHRKLYFILHVLITHIFFYNLVSMIKLQIKITLCFFFLLFSVTQFWKYSQAHDNTRFTDITGIANAIQLANVKPVAGPKRLSSTLKL